MKLYKHALCVITAGFLYSQAATALQLEEVLVTAQKKEQSVQDIPMAISVVSGDNLDDFGITSTADLDNVTPGLIIQETGSNQMTITLRGVGTAPGNESFDQSVSMFIDGVYAGRQREFSAAMYDIDRVEVIKGTQNSLLGKNTSLGAISLITKNPGDELAGDVSLTYEGLYGSKFLNGAVDVPVNDMLSFRLATNQIDSTGHVYNRFTKEDGPRTRKSSFRVKGLLHANPYTDILMSFQMDDDKVLGTNWEIGYDPVGQAQQWDPIYTTETNLDLNTSSFVSLGEDGEQLDAQTASRGNITATTEFDNDFMLTTVLGYSKYDNDRVIDADFSAGDFVTQVVDSDFEQTSVELRLSSPVGEDLEYTVGMFYMSNVMDKQEQTHSDYPGSLNSPTPGESLFGQAFSQLNWSDIDDPNNPGDIDWSAIIPSAQGALGVLADGGDVQQAIAALTNIFPTTGFTVNDLGALLGYGAFESRFKQETNVMSLFSQATYYFLDNQSFTLGMRYTDEAKKAELERVALTAGFFGGAIPDVVNLISFPLYEPLTLTRNEYNFDGSINYNYEFGEASSAYISYGKGTKSGGFADSATFLVNVPYEPEVAETYEIGMKTELLGGAARLNGAIFRTDIQDYQYSQFTGIGFEVRNLQAQNQGFELDGQMLLSENLGLQGGFTFTDVKDTDTGYTLPLSPKITANLAANYNNTYQEKFNYSLGINGSYRSKMYHVQAEGPFYSEPVTRFDLRAAISNLDDTWEVALIGKNITDQLTSGFSGNQPVILDGLNRIEVAEAPRTLSIQAQYKF